MAGASSDGTILVLSENLELFPFVHIWFSTQQTHEQSFLVEALFDELELHNADKLNGKGALLRLKAATDIEITKHPQTIGKWPADMTGSNQGNICTLGVAEIDFMVRSVADAGAIYVVLYGEVFGVLLEVEAARNWIEDRPDLLPIPVVVVDIQSFPTPGDYCIIDLNFDSDQGSGICSIRRFLLEDEKLRSEPLLSYLTNLIQSLSFFKELTADDCDYLIKSAKYEFFPSGQLIMDDAEIINYAKCFIVLKGSAKVVRLNENNQPCVERIYGPRKYFGELSLLDDTIARQVQRSQSRKSEIVAGDDLDLMAIHHASYQSLRREKCIRQVIRILELPVESREDFDAVWMLEVFSKSIKIGSNGFPLDLEFFPEMDQLKRVELVHSLQYRACLQNELICAQGDFENSFCIVLSGTIEALSPRKSSPGIVSDSEEIEHEKSEVLTFGSSFGHAALESRICRCPSTLMALTTVRLIELHRKDFQRIMRSQTESYRASKLAIARRIFPNFASFEDDGQFKIREYRKGDTIVVQGTGLRSICCLADTQGEADQSTTATSAAPKSQGLGLRQVDPTRSEVFFDFIMQGQVQLIRKMEFLKLDSTEKNFLSKTSSFSKYIQDRRKVMPSHSHFRIKQEIPLLELSQRDCITAPDMFTESTVYTCSAIASSDVSILSISMAAMQSNFSVENLNQIRARGLRHAQCCELTLKSVLLCKAEMNQYSAGSHEVNTELRTKSFPPNQPLSAEEWSEWFIAVKRTDLQLPRPVLSDPPSSDGPGSARRLQPDPDRNVTRAQSARGPRSSSYALTQERQDIYRQRLGLNSSKAKDSTQFSPPQYFQKQQRPHTANPALLSQRKHRLDLLATPSARNRRLQQRTILAEPAEVHGCWCNKELPRHNGTIFSLSCRAASTGMPTFCSWTVTNGRILFGPHVTIDDILIGISATTRKTERPPTEAGPYSPVTSALSSAGRGSPFSGANSTSSAPRTGEEIPGSVQHKQEVPRVPS